MENALVVRGGQAVRNLDGELDRLAGRNCAPSQSFAQGPTFEQFRDDERSAFVHAELVNRKNVGMVQLPGGARFLLEPSEAIRVFCEGRRKHLDGHLAPEPRIPRAIDLAHAPGAEWGEDFVRT